jgi:hypothetical protein
MFLVYRENTKCLKNLIYIFGTINLNNKSESVQEKNNGIKVKKVVPKTDRSKRKPKWLNKSFHKTPQYQIAR